MRVAKPIALLLASALLLGACGDDDDDEGNGDQQQARACSPKPPDSEAWASSAEGAGAAPVAPFNKFLRADAPAGVTSSPCDAASVFLHLDRPQGEGVEVDVEVEPEDAADATVTVTLDNLPDDSVRAERWRLDFDEQGDGTIRLASAKRTFRCQPDRGHQDFSSELCV